MGFLRVTISIILALVGTVGGSILTTIGVSSLLERVGAYEPVPGPGILFAGVGLLLWFGAGLTVALSSVGVIVAGAVQAIVTVALMCSPWSFTGDSLLNVWVELLRPFSAEFTGTSVFVIATGIPVFVGIALIAVGIGTILRRRSATARLLSALGGVLAVGAFAVALVPTNTLYRSVVVTYTLDGGALALVLALVVVFGICLFPTGASPLGGWIAGAILTVVGVGMVFADWQLLAPVRALSAELYMMLVTLGPPGLIAVLGATILGLALGVTLRRERPAPGSAYQPPAYTASDYGQQETSYPPPPTYPPQSTPNAG